MPPAGAPARPRRERLENKTVRLPNLCLPQEGVGAEGAPGGQGGGGEPQQVGLRGNVVTPLPSPCWGRPYPFP